jgi:hypothetical protein
MIPWGDLATFGCACKAILMSKLHARCCHGHNEAMNILARLLGHRPQRPDSSAKDRHEQVIDQVLIEGNAPALAQEALAEIADQPPHRYEIEQLDAEEFRRRYRPRIREVSEAAKEQLAASVSADPAAELAT